MKIEAIVLYAVIAPLAAALVEGPISGVIELVLTRVIPYALLLWAAVFFQPPPFMQKRPT
jgi:hypothetical protein